MKKTVRIRNFAGGFLLILLPIVLLTWRDPIIPGKTYTKLIIENESYNPWPGKTKVITDKKVIDEIIGKINKGERMDIPEWERGPDLKFTFTGNNVSFEVNVFGADGSAVAGSYYIDAGIPIDSLFAGE
ncbi:hypothetical protein A8F94_15770 [Bacillus sp. FJAT-27225]|uniref:hypothetical protein n=1 Tax=Bacillus sp. FJAT-27225 TaxID=1743144 RepID=UPI00080C3491|nr:hypothetical protein [Bacillus sp. FJAT-27225]OCA84177.1 hypothetical protein A8F94_15770 [Bacillus sp. FJAT-27225]